MPDYKTLYLKLFNEVTTAIEQLKEAQRQCEELYIESGDDTEDKNNTT